MKARQLAELAGAVDPDLDVLVEFDEGDFIDLGGGNDGIRKAVYVVWDDGSSGWWPAPLIAQDNEDLVEVVDRQDIRNVLVLTTKPGDG